jgi:transcriptional regulator with XRE-family HTH domain
MIKKKKNLIAEEMPEFQASVDSMTKESKIFVDKSIEIVDYIFQLLEQKGLKQKDLAEKMGKTEAELSKILSGMHNLTLRSIAKLEAALEAPIICTPKKQEIDIDIDLLLGSLTDVMSKMIKNTKKKLLEMTYDDCKVVKMNNIKNTKTKADEAA